jgi:hypothetical protein
MNRSNLNSRRKRQNRRFVAAVAAVVTGILLLSQPGVSVAQFNLPILPGAEPNAEGLYPLDTAIMETTAWVDPDVDLSQYTRIFPTTAVHFRDVKDRWHDARTIARAESFYVNDRLKQSMREMFRESIDEALAGARSFERSNQLGRDVLLVQAALTDMISGVPPPVPGSSVMNIRWAWETGLVLEIRDSMSGKVLARTVERNRIDGPMESGMVAALTPIMVDDWARLLVRHLETLRSFYPTPLSRLGESTRQ